MGISQSQDKACCCGARDLEGFGLKPNDVQAYPVYEWRNTSNKKFSYHFEPAWHGEEKVRLAFYAYKDQVMGAEPVYEFWQRTLQERVYHFDGEDKDETMTERRFYAFRSMPNMNNVKGEIVGIYTVPYVHPSSGQPGPRIKMDAFNRRPRNVQATGHFFALRALQRIEHEKMKTIAFNTLGGYSENRTPFATKVDTGVTWARVKEMLAKKFNLGSSADIMMTCEGVALDETYKVMDYTLRDATTVLVVLPPGSPEVSF